MKATLAQLARGLGDAVFPPICVHCRELIETNGQEAGGFRHLCPRCVTQLEFGHAPQCTTCGHPFYGVVEGERMCPHCEGLDPAFREGRTAVLFKGPVRALVIELKYHRGLHVLTDMAEILRRAPDVLEFVRGAVLVPVPLHPRKERERGFNQSRQLARAFARAAGGGTRVVEPLRRTVDTRTQTRLDRRARQENLKNAFALAPRRRINPTDRLVLVDDVFTTGATLNACAAVLRRAGCVNLDVATFGHG